MKGISDMTGSTGVGRVLAAMAYPPARVSFQREMEIEEAWMQVAATAGPRWEDVRAEVERRLAVHAGHSRRSTMPLDPAAVIRAAAREVAEGIL